MGFYDDLEIVKLSHEWWKKRKKPEPDSLTIYQPPITISRERGSGGGIIAKELSKKLNFLLVDKELLKRIKTTKYSEKHLGELDERIRKNSDEFGMAILGIDFMTQDEFVKQLINEIRFFAKKGEVIILGRGGNFILSSEKALHIRVVASLKNRTKNIIRDNNYSEKEARDLILKTDQDRYSFIKKYFEKNNYDPLSYDLVINTDYFTQEEAVKMIIVAYQNKFKIK